MIILGLVAHEERLDDSDVSLETLVEGNEPLEQHAPEEQTYEEIVVEKADLYPVRNTPEMPSKPSTKGEEKLI